MSVKDNAEHCVFCGRTIPEGNQVCVICGRGKPKKMTNYDRIRNMNVEEMAKFLTLNSVDDAVWIDGYTWIYIDEIEQWLESEVDAE